MRQKLVLVTVLLLPLSLTVAVAHAADAAAPPSAPAVDVPFPKDWRSFTHIKSMAIVDAVHPLFVPFGGIHHVYANPAAREALAKKAPFPDGSVLVFDLLEGQASQGAFNEGKRKILATMKKDAKRYAATAGWGFQGWVEGDPKRPALQTSAEQITCKACHDQVATTGHVFSQWRP